MVRLGIYLLHWWLTSHLWSGWDWGFTFFCFLPVFREWRWLGVIFYQLSCFLNGGAVGVFQRSRYQNLGFWTWISQGGIFICARSRSQLKKKFNKFWCLATKFVRFVNFDSSLKDFNSLYRPLSQQHHKILEGSFSLSYKPWHSLQRRLLCQRIQELNKLRICCGNFSSERSVIS